MPKVAAATGDRAAANNPNTTRRVLIVDDHASFADALALLLTADGFDVIEVATTEKGAAQAISSTPLDLALLDLELTMHDAAGLRLGEQLRRQRPKALLVFLSQHVRADTVLVRRALALRPEGLVSKEERGERIVNAVRLAFDGATYISPETRPYMRGSRLFAADERMTPTEQLILEELARDPDSRTRLARRIGVAPSTLDSHLSAIKGKVLEDLQADGGGPADGHLSTEALIGWARRHGYQYR